MLAVFAPEADVRAALMSTKADDVAIAAVNGPKLTVVSGRSEAAARVAAATGATSRALNVSHAFHSPLMAPATEAFRQEAAAVTGRRPTVRFFSTLLGREATDELADTTYWINHI